MSVNAFMAQLLELEQAQAGRRRLARDWAAYAAEDSAQDVGYSSLPAGAVTGLRQPSWANCAQVFTVDRSRLKSRLGQAPAEALGGMARVLAEVLGL